MSTCHKCGLDHGRLGIEIAGRTMQRSADKERHILRISGGAWAFESVLFSQHPEIESIIITDRGTGEKWRTDRRTFDAHAFVVGASGREQLALALKYWTGQSEPGDRTGPGASNAVQPLLFESKMPSRSYYEPARGKRPRIYKHV